MQVYNLPHDLLPAGSPAPAEVIIRSYESAQSSLKNRMVLHYNMLNLLIDGRKTIARAAGTTTVYQDEILLMAAGNALTSELLSDNGRFRSVLIYFSSAVLEDFYVRHATLLSSGAGAPSQPLVTFAKDSFIRHYIESLPLLLSTNPPPEIQRLKLEELLLYLLHTNPAGLRAFRRSPHAGPPALELRKVVETHVAQPITVAELAFLCHMSVSTFQRKFAAIYGVSPQQWLLQRRMELAASLLHRHHLPGEVYQQVGYESHSSFSEAFKKVFGVSPSTFRQQHVVLTV